MMRHNPPHIQMALMRHARTEWNEQRRIQGWHDSPLCSLGVEQARENGKRLAALEFQGILCSDLGRAVATAELMNESLRVPLFTDRRLRERNFGSLEGRPLSEKLKNDIMQDEEPLSRLLNRVVAGLQDAHRFELTKILVVTHHVTIQTILSHLAGPDHPLREGRLLKSGRIHWIGLHHKHMGIVQLNDKVR